MDLKTKYKKEVIPKMKEKFGFKNDLAVPKIEKVIVNVGLPRVITERDPQYVGMVKESLMKITGQKPIETYARKSISGFKIKKGMVVGLKVTLRGKRMYDFLTKLINVALPRIRDFRGIPQTSVDKSGNLSLGFSEHLVFPEIKPEDVQKTHGLEVVIVTNAKDREKGLELFKLLGFPFRTK
jgi:large subunit ribosomal protein L5